MMDTNMFLSNTEYYILKRLTGGQTDYQIVCVNRGGKPLYGNASWDIHQGPFDSFKEANENFSPATYEGPKSVTPYMYKFEMVLNLRDSEPVEMMTHVPLLDSEMKAIGTVSFYTHANNINHILGVIKLDDSIFAKEAAERMFANVLERRI